MKTIVFLGLFALLLMGGLSSCELLFGHDEPDIVAYNLALSFQDASGNDLVKGIGLEEPPVYIPEEQAHWGFLKRDLYALDIIASQSCEDAIAAHKKRYPYTPEAPRLGMYSFNNFSCLISQDAPPASECPDERVLTYKLKCPYIFGDEAEHEIVTYWEIPKMRNGFADAKCNHVEFEDRVFTPVTTDDDFYPRVIIILKDEDSL